MKKAETGVRACKETTFCQKEFQLGATVVVAVGEVAVVVKSKKRLVALIRFDFQVLQNLTIGFIYHLLSQWLLTKLSIF
ncbi:MAG: hypothetical protein RMY28_036315 [Nostoc sp. ChiSLP01]|nr:hypothetical protein [Nostoc sp. CmiSLP01]MDZ8286345.1 hypothetical protein [Nostoc sp. ChiSLP01]